MSDTRREAGKGKGKEQDEKRSQHRETLRILEEMAALLNTTLDRQELACCVALIEKGVHPAALANIVLEMKTRYRKADSAREQHKI